MSEIELTAENLTEQDNTINVEMSKDEIWFLKTLIGKYNPKKIVEIGVSAGGNTVNILHWKDKNSQLISIDISTHWYRDNTKLSGFMADELPVKDNWKIYRGCDYLEVYKEIGNDIDFIIIDTIHHLPGEFLSFLAVLPQLKDGCVVVLHDIHLNMVNFSNNMLSELDGKCYCTGLLYGGISSNNKLTLKTDMPNIGAFIVDETTRENIKDIFHILCTTWTMFPSELNLKEYSKFIKENYDIECYDLFKKCLKLQSTYYDYESKKINKIKKFMSNF